MADFYDELAPLYHLIFEDWDASIERQGQQLSAIIRNRWPLRDKLLDVSCGIGTQAIALAKNGFHVTGSDLSPKAIDRAVSEAEKRGQAIAFSVCDMRNGYAHHGGGFDIVISCDNSLPHLLSEDILLTLKAMFACLRPGGGCLLTVRDYDSEPRGRNLVKLYGIREENNKRYVLFQVWDFERDQYDLTMYFVEEELSSKKVQTHTMRSRYYAIGIGRLLRLMQAAGFQNVERLSEGFYQPVLVGTKAEVEQ